jgi:hypothetical protein
MPPRPPEWFGPGDGDLPGFVPVRVVLWRGPDVVIVLRDLEAYRTGVAMSLTVLSRDGAIDPMAWHQSMLGGAEGYLRIGVGFSDGRRTAIDDRAGRSWSPTEPPDGPILMPRGGSGGGGNRFDMGLWLWPLPPPGDLTVAVAWDQQGVPETLHVLDADVILEASRRAEHLWDPVPPDPRRWMTRGMAATSMAIAMRAEPPPDPDAPPEVTGALPADRDDAVTAIVEAFRRVFRGGTPEEKVAAVDDGDDLLDAFTATGPNTRRFPDTINTLDVVAFVDADHAVVRWSVHGATPTPYRIESRMVRTPGGWRVRRASALHVLRLSGVPTPPD